MRTQLAHLHPTWWQLRAAVLALAPALLFPVSAAHAQGDGSASGSDGVTSTTMLLAGAAALFLLALLVGLGLPALRRRHGRRVAPAAGLDPSMRMAPTNLPPHSDASVVPPLSATARRRRRTHPGHELALGYTTFPERRRVVSPESRYQARSIESACEARQMVLHQLVGDVQSYSGPDLERPGLTHALELLAAGEATCLVVTGLDRLSRSAANLGTLIDWLDELGARLVVIDIDLDTRTEEGRLAARALARVGSLERRSGREPAHIAPPHRAEQTTGRPAVADRPLLQRRIATMRAGGMTLQAIADTLNSEGVPTMRGGAKWRPSSVQAATGYRRPGRQTRAPEPTEHEDTA